MINGRHIRYAVDGSTANEPNEEGLCESALVGPEYKRPHYEGGQKIKLRIWSMVSVNTFIFQVVGADSNGSGVVYNLYLHAIHLS